MNTKIQTLSILRDFHKITGARISLHDLDYNEIAGYPKELSAFCSSVQCSKAARSLCVEADKRAFETVQKTEEACTYTCHCGLIETVAPIYHYGVLSGYFMMGQVCSDDDSAVENVKKLSKRFFSSSSRHDEICEQIPRLDDGILSSYINILKILAEYMTHTNCFAPKRKDLAAAAKQYIHKNFSDDISINSMCEVFECSRTTLMNSFKKRYGSTLGEYINKYRLSQAEAQLRTTKKSVKLIASECGFSDQNYFSKAFLKEYSLVPSEYRKQFYKAAES